MASKLAKDYLGPISVAAYSYMSLVPIIQPPVIRALTTRHERAIKMEYHEIEVPKSLMVVFPIVVTFVAGFVAPISVPLVGTLMFGNLIRECGVLERLSKAAQNELANIVTILLGITIGSTMRSQTFLQPATMLIIVMGLVAFVFDTAGGVLFAKLLNVFLKRKINPMIGACGISAFPMSARVIQKMAQEEDPHHRPDAGGQRQRRRSGRFDHRRRPGPGPRAHAREVRCGMFEQMLARIRDGSEINKGLFVMVVGVLGVFLVLAFFFGLIHLLRRVLKK